MPIASGLQPNIFRAVSGSLFSSPVNWSRGVVPTGSDVAMIADNCTIDISRTLGSLVVRAPFTASINTGLTVRVNDVINVMGHLSCSGNPTVILQGSKNIINTLSPGTSLFYYSGSIDKNSIPGVNYFNLQILTGGGSAGPRLTRTAIGNISVSGTLGIFGGALFDMGAYNLNVSGGVSLSGVSSPRLIKSGPGNIVFGGLVNWGFSSVGHGIDFENGNPNVELRNGISVQDNDTYFKTGNGTWYFTTNNQTLFKSSTNTNVIDANFIISGSINLTYNTGNSTIFLINNTVNGTEPSSKFTVQGRWYFNTVKSTIGVMSTGSFDFTSSAASVLGYVFTDNFTLPYTYYRGLYIANAGVKSLSGSTSVSGSLELPLGSTLDLKSFDLNVSGATTLANGSTSKIIGSGSGYSTFRGQLITGFSGNNNGIDFSNSTRTTEFQGGMNIADTSGLIFNLGTGLTRFTTNNQALLAGGGFSTMSFYGPVSIENISVTNSLANPIYLYAPINGTTAGSTFKNNASLYFSNSASLSGSFVTGTLDLSTVNNNVGLVGNYSGTTPTRLNTFFNLVISGTGIKTLGTSSYLSGSLSFGNAGTLELSSSNFTVSGSVTFNNNNSTLPMPLTKSGPGNVLFIGPFISQYINYTVDFSAGNPNVELRGGMNVNAIDQSRFKSGTGSWYFNGTQQIGQTIYGGTLQFDGPVLVGSGSVVGFTTPYVMIINTSSYVDGVAPSSKFVNSGSLYLYTSRSVMLTGSFDHLSNTTSVIGYMFNGNYTLPYTAYQGLRIDGSGSKYTSGNTYLSQSYYGAGFGNLELGNYNFTISGSTTFSTNVNSGTGSLTKSGSGTVIFGGLVRSDYQSYTIDFSVGNPTVEVRNGMELNSQDPLRFKAGSGSWNFTTNNQFFGNTAYGGNYVFSGSFIVGNDITLTHNGNAYNVYILGALNGSNANSKYYMAGSSNIVYYYNSQIPMQTGILDVTGSTTTTFIYASGSQNVKGGIYRNLTFLNGLKTLQGNVSVLGTFSTGSGATSGSFNLNGFTLTNP